MTVMEQVEQQLKKKRKGWKELKPANRSTSKNGRVMRF